jgi:hypothetical protein
VRLFGMAAGAQKKDCDQNKKKHRDADEGSAAGRAGDSSARMRYLGG